MSHIILLHKSISLNKPRSHITSYRFKFGLWSTTDRISMIDVEGCSSSLKTMFKNSNNIIVAVSVTSIFVKGSITWKHLISYDSLDHASKELNHGYVISLHRLNMVIRDLTKLEIKKINKSSARTL